jgi:hypothetical protein
MALTRSVLAALLVSNPYVFENAFIAHFRAAHLDAFQLAFALAALTSQSCWPWIGRDRENLW